MKAIIWMIVLLVTQFMAWAQDAVMPVQRMGPAKVMIVNETGSRQEIFLGEESSELELQVIEKDETWISKPFSHRPHIRIYTDERFQEYMLLTGKSYRLFWDSRKKCYDIKMIKGSKR